MWGEFLYCHVALSRGLPPLLVLICHASLIRTCLCYKILNYHFTLISTRVVKNLHVRTLQTVKNFCNVLNRL